MPSIQLTPFCDEFWSYHRFLNLWVGPVSALNSIHEPPPACCLAVWLWVRLTRRPTCWQPTGSGCWWEGPSCSSGPKLWRNGRLTRRRSGPLLTAAARWKPHRSRFQCGPIERDWFCNMCAPFPAHLNSSLYVNLTYLQRLQWQVIQNLVKRSKSSAGCHKTSAVLFNIPGRQA